MLLTTWPSLRDDNNDYDNDIMNYDNDDDNCTIVHTTSSQINDMFLFHRVIKILTAGRTLQISIA